MYRAHWGLREAPFRGHLDPRFFYQSPTHEEALARLHFLVEENHRLGLLLGESGAGKSLVLEVFSREFRRGSGQLANLSLLGVDAHELLWMMAADFGLSPSRSDDTFRLWRSISDRLTENRYQQVNTLLLLDDADEATSEVCDQITRLIQADSLAHGRLIVVLASTVERAGRLGQRLLQLTDLRIDLDAWQEEDIDGFITDALAQAGRRQATFDHEAIVRLRQLTGGVPRRVTKLANLALLAGAGRRLTKIDAVTVEAAHHELGVAAAGVPANSIAS